MGHRVQLNLLICMFPIVFVNLHIETGLANGLSLLHNAHSGGTPLVLSAGNKDSREIAPGKTDLIDMVSPFTKWAVEVNHPDAIALAKRTIKAAAENTLNGAGIDSVKLSNVIGKELFKYCKKYKITIFASVFDKKSIDILEKLNCPAYKIASPEITDIPLIEYAAKTNKPIILSNGLANYNDLLLAYNCIKRKKNNKIIILKCTSSYPAKKNNLNLRTMGDIKKKFKVNSGFSDHTIGIDSAIYAASIGADMIEKHITLDQKIKTIDSFFSLKIKKFKLMIDKIRENEKSYGKINYNIAKESKINLNGRRSLYVINYIKKNEKFTSKNIKSIRPSYGLHPKFFSKIIGKFAKKDLPQGTRLKWSLIKKNN